MAATAKSAPTNVPAEEEVTVRLSPGVRRRMNPSVNSVARLAGRPEVSAVLDAAGRGRYSELVRAANVADEAAVTLGAGGGIGDRVDVVADELASLPTDVTAAGIIRAAGDAAAAWAGRDLAAAAADRHADRAAADVLDALTAGEHVVRKALASRLDALLERIRERPAILTVRDAAQAVAEQRVDDFEAGQDVAREYESIRQAQRDTDRAYGGGEVPHHYTVASTFRDVTACWPDWAWHTAGRLVPTPDGGTRPAAGPPWPENDTRRFLAWCVRTPGAALYVPSSRAALEHRSAALETARLAALNPGGAAPAGQLSEYARGVRALERQQRRVRTVDA